MKLYIIESETLSISVAEPIFYNFELYEPLIQLSRLLYDKKHVAPKFGAGEIQEPRAGADQKRTANNETNNGFKKELTQLQKQPRAISVFSH